MKKEEMTKDITYSKDRIALSRQMRIIIFLLLFIIQGAVNASSGLLSSASKEMKTTMNLNDKEFGMFGTSNGFGRILGSMVYIMIVNTINRKWILVVTLLVKAGLLFLFSVSSNLWLMIGIRGLIGFQHNILMVYIPVWIDQFGIQKFKTFFMAMIQIIVPIGKVSGYLLHLLFGSDKWKFGFVVEGFLLLVTNVFFFFSPDKYFLNTLVVVNDITQLQNDEKFPKVSIFEKREVVVTKGKKSSFLDEFKEIMSSKLFVCCLFIKAIVFGVSTVIHYWIGDYMRTVLLIDKTKVFESYTVIAIVGPLGGLVVGSIASYFFGGYEKKHSSITLILAQCLACCFGIPSPFFHSIYYYCCFSTLFFVFNSVIHPLVQGITITSVKPEHKGTAFTISTFTTMLLTSGPFPLMYGAINDYFKLQYQWAAMLFIMIIFFMGIIPMIILVILRYKLSAEKENKEFLLNNDNN